MDNDQNKSYGVDKQKIAHKDSFNNCSKKNILPKKNLCNKLGSHKAEVRKTKDMNKITKAPDRSQNRKRSTTMLVIIPK